MFFGEALYPPRPIGNGCGMFARDLLLNLASGAGDPFLGEAL